MTPATTSNADWMEVVTHVVISEWNSNPAVASAFAQLRAKALSLNSPSGEVLKRTRAARARRESMDHLSAKRNRFRRDGLA